MKRISLILLLAMPIFLFGQDKEGVVSYTQKVNLHMGLGEGNEEMKAMLPEFQESKYELLFHDFSLFTLSTFSMIIKASTTLL